MTTELLELKMQKFQNLMYEKLLRVAYKHGGLDSSSSVTSDSFNWSNTAFIQSVITHLKSEIYEWEHSIPEKEQEELVDIANCAMILCMMKKAVA